MRGVPDRDRWVALALLLAVLVAAYLLFVHPWWTMPMVELGNDIESLQQRELRARMELQQRNAVERRLMDVRALEQQSPVFLHEASVELATAALAQRIETAIAEASPGNRACAISNRSPGAIRSSGDRFERVVVRVRMRCGNAELAKVLDALEGGVPTLFVEHLNVMGLGRYSMVAGDAQAGAGGLDVEFELHGFLQPRLLPGGKDAH